MTNEKKQKSRFKNKCIIKLCYEPFFAALSSSYYLMKEEDDKEKNVRLSINIEEEIFIRLTSPIHPTYALNLCLKTMMMRIEQHVRSFHVYFCCI